MGDIQIIGGSCEISTCKTNGGKKNCIGDGCRFVGNKPDYEKLWTDSCFKIAELKESLQASERFRAEDGYKAITEITSLQSEVEKLRSLVHDSRNEAQRIVAENEKEFVNKIKEQHAEVERLKKQNELLIEAANILAEKDSRNAAQEPVKSLYNPPYTSETDLQNEG